MSESEEEDVCENQIKAVILGDASVGKSCIVRRFCYDEFSRQYNSTVGADFHIKRTTIGGQRQIVLKITDISGHELSGNMLDKYMFGTNIAILIYDITSVASFDNLSNWLKYLSKVSTMPATAIVGNKCDLEHQRAVRLDRTKRFAEEHGVASHCVSAKTGESVALCVMNLVARHLGVTIESVERELQQQLTVKAEFTAIATKHDHTPNNDIANSFSSVCTLQ